MPGTAKRHDELLEKSTAQLRHLAKHAGATPLQLKWAEGSADEAATHRAFLLDLHARCHSPVCLSTDWLKAYDNMQHDFIFAVHGRVFGEPDLDASIKHRCAYPHNLTHMHRGGVGAQIFW